MSEKEDFDVIIVGGSYSGLAAGMALGRALRKVCIVDDQLPCNRSTPFSHNFLTQDGNPPGAIAAIAKAQVANYATVEFLKDTVIGCSIIDGSVVLKTAKEKTISGKKLILASGIKDIMQEIPGFEECWGISVLHCPYCHGYEVRGKSTALLANGDFGFEFAILLSNWTGQLTVYTNGASLFTAIQRATLKRLEIPIVETPVVKLVHEKGYVNQILLADGTAKAIDAVYTKPAFEQRTNIARSLECEIDDDGYIKVDNLQRTSVKGVFASGDNCSRMRTVANAVSTGTTAGMACNKELVMEKAVAGN